jgi:predicted HicB family RNase H-like nuclease
MRSGGESERQQGNELMTITLRLKPEIEAGLRAQAQARGLSLEAYVEQ